MKASMTILFFVKKTKLNANGHAPIYFRVTIEGRRFESSTKRYVHIQQWSASAGKQKGYSVDAKSLNTFLD